MKDFSNNKLYATILMLFCAFWGYLTYKLPDGTVSGAPGPSFFPFFILICLFILAILLFFSKKDLILRRETELNKKNKTEVQKKIFRTLRPYMYFLLILIYIIAVPHLGFLVSTFISLTIILLVNKKLSYLSILTTSLLTSVSLFLVFKLILGISLPSGILI